MKLKNLFSLLLLPLFLFACGQEPEGAKKVSGPPKQPVHRLNVKGIIQYPSLDGSGKIVALRGDKDLVVLSADMRDTIAVYHNFAGFGVRKIISYFDPTWDVGRIVALGIGKGQAAYFEISPQYSTNSLTPIDWPFEFDPRQEIWDAHFQTGAVIPGSRENFFSLYLWLLGSSPTAQRFEVGLHNLKSFNYLPVEEITADDGPIYAMQHNPVASVFIAQKEMLVIERTIGQIAVTNTEIPGSYLGTREISFIGSKASSKKVAILGSNGIYIADLPGAPKQFLKEVQFRDMDIAQDGKIYLGRAAQDAVVVFNPSSGEGEEIALDVSVITSLIVLRGGQELCVFDKEGRANVFPLRDLKKTQGDSSFPTKAGN